MRSNMPPPQAIANDLTWGVKVSSWMGKRLLGESIPVENGNATYSIDQEVPDNLELSVPRYALGTDWEPKDARHPLARYGQQLTVDLVIRAGGHKYQSALGRYQIQGWEEDDGLINVTGKGLLQKAVDDELELPRSPTKAATFRTEAWRVAPEGVTIVFHRNLQDRPVTRDLTWGVSRIETLYELAKAWPARLRVGPDGRVHFLPPLALTPYQGIELTDGEGGTVVGAPKSDTREGLYNKIIVEPSSTTSQTDTPTFKEVEFIGHGPMSVHTYGAVTLRESSELIQTRPQAQAVAKNRIHELGRASYVLPIELAPDPRLEVDDPVNPFVRGERLLGWINGWDISLIYSEVMRIDVGVNSA